MSEAEVRYTEQMVLNATGMDVNRLYRAMTKAPYVMIARNRKGRDDYTPEEAGVLYLCHLLQDQAGFSDQTAQEIIKQVWNTRAAWTVLSDMMCSGTGMSMILVWDRGGILVKAEVYERAAKPTRPKIATEQHGAVLVLRLS